MKILNYKINNWVVAGGSLAIAGLAFATYTSIHRRNLIKKIFKALEDLEAGEGDSVESLDYSSAFDPKYWSKFPSSIMTQAQAVSYAQQLRKYIHGTFGTSDEESIIGLFKKFQNKAWVSKISDVYQTLYKVDFLKDLKTIDSPTGNDMQTILQIVKAMPAN